MQPKRPNHVSEYAVACLGALASGGLGRHISLGGALGLAHYHRETEEFLRDLPD